MIIIENENKKEKVKFMKIEGSEICLVKQQVKKRRKGEKIKAHSFSPFFFFLLLSLSKNSFNFLSLNHNNNTHIRSLYHEIPITFSLLFFFFMSSSSSHYTHC